jgi:hypothetical protein
MHSLDGVPDTLTIDLRDHGGRTVQRGSPLGTTYVGAYKDTVTLAQLPLAAGDTWSVDLTLRCGVYQLALDGWENPAHGILHLWLDGRPAGQIDWRWHAMDGHSPADGEMRAVERRRGQTDTALDMPEEPSHGATGPDE